MEQKFLTENPENLEMAEDKTFENPKREQEEYLTQEWGVLLWACRLILSSILVFFFFFFYIKVSRDVILH